MWGVCDVEDKQACGPVFLDTPWELMPLSLSLYLVSLQPADEHPASHSYTTPPLSPSRAGDLPSSSTAGEGLREGL